VLSSLVRHYDQFLAKPEAKMERLLWLRSVVIDCRFKSVALQWLSSGNYASLMREAASRSLKTRMPVCHETFAQSRDSASAVGADRFRYTTVATMDRSMGRDGYIGPGSVE